MNATDVMAGIAIVMCIAAFVAMERRQPQPTLKQIEVKTMNVMQEEAQVILNFLRDRKVITPIESGYKTPGFHVYKLAMDSTQRMTKLNEVLDDMQSLLYAWRVKHGLIDADDPDVRVVCRTQAQPFALEVNRPKIETLHIEDVQWQAQPFVALAGVSYLTKQGQPLTWNITDPSTPHALVAGSSGSGKSNLLLSLALSLAMGTPPDRLSIYVVDGGNSTLLELGKLPHARQLATDTDEAIALVAHIKALVLERKVKSMTNPDSRCLLVVDELANLMAVMEKKTVEAFQADLAVIAAEGRKFGIHMLVCTQKPLAEVTGSLAKSNMAVRFVGSMSSKIDANTAAGSAGTGAERLAGKGDFIRVIGGNVRRFQVPMVDNVLMVIRKVKATWAGVEISPERQAVATTTATRVVAPVVPVVAMKSQAQLDAELLRQPWQAGMSQAEMIRIMLGRPGDMSVNTGGANRKRMFDALDLLQKQENSATTITTTTKKQVKPAFLPENVRIGSSSGSGSSDFKPM
jgi:DNA segregation ATPase FtsK/SpoIIIE, S-DNA-T family